MFHSISDVGRLGFGPPEMTQKVGGAAWNIEAHLAPGKQSELSTISEPTPASNLNLSSAIMANQMHSLTTLIKR